MSNSLKDHKGRPVIVVTGMGVVTSLGQGQQDNWRDLIAGKSGIRHIKRFSTEGLRTTIAGCVDFLDVDPYSAPALSIAMAESAASEAIEQARYWSQRRFSRTTCFGDAANRAGMAAAPRNLCGRGC